MGLEWIHKGTKHVQRWVYFVDVMQANSRVVGR
jgi:hypothetical protein